MQFRNNKKSFITILSLVIVTLSVHLLSAQSVDFAQAVQARFDSTQQELEFPGATLAFIMHDGTHFSFAAGLSDLEKNSKMLYFEL